MKFTGIPYRHWRGSKARPKLALPGRKSPYSRVMHHVGIALDRGDAVTMDHRIVNAEPKYGETYDVIDVTIEEIRA